jgi:hypothetical protein
VKKSNHKSNFLLELFADAIVAEAEIQKFGEDASISEQDGVP